MKKTVLLIRHPSVVWRERDFRRAEREGKEVETYVPIDKNGWKMAKCLLDHLERELPGILDGEPLAIFTSPLKRARDLAKTIGKAFSVQPTELGFFTEVPATTNTKEMMAIIKAAEKRGVPAAKLWFEENENQNELLEKLNYHLSFLAKGLRVLENSATSVSLVFSHRAAIALTLWLIQERKKRENLTFAEKDIPVLSAIGGKVAYTSISQIEFRDGRWDTVSIAQVPHLKWEPHLVRGTF